MRGHGLVRYVPRIVPVVVGSCRISPSHVSMQWQRTRQTGRMGSMDIVEINPETHIAGSNEGGMETVNLTLTLIASALGSRII